MKGDRLVDSMWRQLARWPLTTLWVAVGLIVMVVIALSQVTV